jgi:hypothetical protein
MENIKEPYVENNVELYVEEVDENDDLQMRLWYQFMRNPDERPTLYRSPKNARSSNYSANNQSIASLKLSHNSVND